MAKLLSRIAGFFSSRSLVGVDKAGNRYFTRKEEIDGILDWEAPSMLNFQKRNSVFFLLIKLVKEKRWVIFKGEEDSTSIPVEWICWLNGQRKQAPTPEEMAELERRRELVRQNVELLKKKEEEERSSSYRQSKSISKSESPDLKSFIQQFPNASLDQKIGSEDASDAKGDTDDKERSSEPTGSGESFQPGTWQPPA